MIKLGGRYKWINPDYGIEVIVTVMQLPHANNTYNPLYDCSIDQIISGIPKNDHLFKIGNVVKLGSSSASFIKLTDPVDILKEML